MEMPLNRHRIFFHNTVTVSVSTCQVVCGVWRIPSRTVLQLLTLLPLKFPLTHGIGFWYLRQQALQDFDWHFIHNLVFTQANNLAVTYILHNLDSEGSIGTSEDVRDVSGIPQVHVFSWLGDLIVQKTNDKFTSYLTEEPASKPNIHFEPTSDLDPCCLVFRSHLIWHCTPPPPTPHDNGLKSLNH